MKDVTLVITSCGRFDLLEKTLDSFFKFNSYPIAEIIITEDSTEGEKLKKLIKKYGNKNFNLIINKERLGQLKSIDKAYSLVKTEYIFHCEDDWEFLKTGFIEKSLEVIENDKMIAIVGLRPEEDYDERTPILPDHYFSPSGEEFFEMRDHVFSYNPGLRRKDVCDLYGENVKLEGTLWEDELSRFYKGRGYRMVSFVDRYVRHLGYKRHVHFSEKRKNTVLSFKIDRFIKKMRATYLKITGKLK